MSEEIDRAWALEVYQLLTYNALMQLEGIAEHGIDFEPWRIYVQPLLDHDCIEAHKVEGWKKPYFTVTPFGRAVLDAKAIRLAETPEAQKLRRLERTLNEIREKAGTEK